jgi:hypothetical protein
MASQVNQPEELPQTEPVKVLAASSWKWLKKAAYDQLSDGGTRFQAAADDVLKSKLHSRTNDRESFYSVLSKYLVQSLGLKEEPKDSAQITTSVKVLWTQAVEGLRSQIQHKLSSEQLDRASEALGVSQQRVVKGLMISMIMSVVLIVWVISCAAVRRFQGWRSSKKSKYIERKRCHHEEGEILLRNIAENLESKLMNQVTTAVHESANSFMGLQQNPASVRFEQPGPGRLVIGQSSITRAANH